MEMIAAGTVDVVVVMGVRIVRMVMAVMEMRVIMFIRVIVPSVRMIIMRPAAAQCAKKRASLSP